MTKKLNYLKSGEIEDPKRSFSDETKCDEC